jgi:SagB-type dehydrogenase family enzyme
MDWSTQPDPFRRYEGAGLLRLDEIPPTPEPIYDAVFVPEKSAPRPVERRSISQLLYDSLALSAWKEMGSSRWPLRVNPSSGNLHPTEGYLVAGPISGLSGTPGLYHYSPYEHALEVRATLSDSDWSELTCDLPPGALFIGLTSILWRESWKYGERAFRYCQHDVGHAIASVALAASALGWRCLLLTGWTDPELAILLGVSGQSGIEAEHADCLIMICPAPGASPPEGIQSASPSPRLLDRLSRAPLSGEPNRLSPDHHPWPVIDAVAKAGAVVERIDPEHHPSPVIDEVTNAAPHEVPPPPASPEECPGIVAGAPAGRSRDSVSSGQQPGAPSDHGPIPARRIIRQRRSAVAMDGRTGLSRERFFGMMERLLPRPGRNPFAPLPWVPAIDLVLFVHRVEGLEAGIYCLVRSAGARDDLKGAMRPEFAWSPPAGCPEALPLYLLSRGDCRDVARAVSCHQEIASDGAFALAMIAGFEPLLRAHGAWLYRRLHWEAGAVGQVLYLEAEAAGVQATGIGCYFDDALHRAVGLKDKRYQDLYHFTVGGAVNDPRLRTAPAYAHLASPASPSPARHG